MLHPQGGFAKKSGWKSRVTQKGFCYTPKGALERKRTGKAVWPGRGLAAPSRGLCKEKWLETRFLYGSLRFARRNLGTYQGTDARTLWRNNCCATPLQQESKQLSQENMLAAASKHNAMLICVLPKALYQQSIDNQSPLLC